MGPLHYIVESLDTDPVVCATEEEAKRVQEKFREKYGAETRISSREQDPLSYVGVLCRKDGMLFRLMHHDPRHGFWAVNTVDPADCRSISERAVGRTFHPVYSA